MATDSTELTFVRCPACRSLVPAVSPRCRMCGSALEAGAKNAPTEGRDDVKQSRVRQRTTSSQNSELSSALNRVRTEGPSSGDASLAGGSNGDSSATAAAGLTETQIAPSADDQSSRGTTNLRSGGRLANATRTMEAVSPKFEDTDDTKDDWERVTPSAILLPSESTASSEKATDYSDASDVDASKNEVATDGDFEQSELDPLSSYIQEIEPKVSHADTNGSTHARDEVVAGAHESKLKELQSTRQISRSQSGDQSSEHLSNEPSRPGLVSGSVEGLSKRSSSGFTLKRGKEDTSEMAIPERAESTQVPNVHSRGLRVESSPRIDTQSSGRNAGKPSATEARTAARKPKPMPVHEDSDHAGRLSGWLVSYHSDPDGQAIELREGKFFVSGSSLKPTDLVLDDPTVSTPHALIRIDDSGVVRVQDLMSEHGIAIKRRGSDEFEPAEEHCELAHGDCLRFGAVEFLITLVPYVGER